MEWSEEEFELIIFAVMYVRSHLDFDLMEKYEIIYNKLIEFKNLEVD